MPRQVSIDLRGAPPVTGGQRDHVDPDRYRLAVVNVEDGNAKSGARMWTLTAKVIRGLRTDDKWFGSSLQYNFTFTKTNGEQNKIGLGQIHWFLACLKLPVGEKQITLDLDRLTGLEFEADVMDGEFESNGVTRKTSEIKRFFPASPNGMQAPAQQTAQAPKPQAPAPPAAPSEPAPWEGTAESAPAQQEVAPPPAQPVAAQPAQSVAAASTPEAMAQVEQDVEDLFK